MLVFFYMCCVIVGLVTAAAGFNIALGWILNDRVQVERWVRERNQLANFDCSLNWFATGIMERFSLDGGTCIRSKISIPSIVLHGKWKTYFWCSTSLNWSTFPDGACVCFVIRFIRAAATVTTRLPSSWPKSTTCAIYGRSIDWIGSRPAC